MLDVKEPYIYSHAHGGCRYKLEAPRVVVEIVKGNVHQLKMQCMAVLSKSGDFFSYGSDKPVMAQVMKWGKLKVLDAMWMTDELDRRIEFRQVMGSGSSRKSVPADTPSGVSASLLTNFIKFKGFPPLEAVIQDPILRLDGSLLNTPGYDSQTKLYLVDRPGSSFSIPVNPSQEEAATAVNVLWAPFAEFPWCGAVDRGVVFAAELTACLRPILLTAPGFGFDAPTAGTGKTLAAKAIGALATGVEPPVIPPVPPRDDETRKRLFALLMEAVRVILLDNLIDPLGNAALDSFLTAKFYSDRPLSTSNPCRRSGHDSRRERRLCRVVGSRHGDLGFGHGALPVVSRNRGAGARSSRVRHWRPSDADQRDAGLSMAAPHPAPASAGLTDADGFFHADVADAARARGSRGGRGGTSRADRCGTSGGDRRDASGRSHGRGARARVADIYAGDRGGYRLPPLFCRTLGSYGGQHNMCGIGADAFVPGVETARLWGSRSSTGSSRRTGSRPSVADLAYRRMLDGLAPGLSFLALHFTKPGEIEAVDPGFHHVRTAEYPLFRSGASPIGLRGTTSRSSGCGLRDAYRACRRQGGVMDRIGVGLIGIGFMGKCHAMAYGAVRAVYGDVPVIDRVALCDVDAGHAAAARPPSALHAPRPTGAIFSRTRPST